MAEFRMPSLGADMAAGTLIAWRCAEGDAISRGDIIAEVETDKGVIEVESYETGVVEALLVPTGQRVPVGTPLARIRTGADTSQAAPPTPLLAAAPSPPPLASAAPPVKPAWASPSARHLAHALSVDLSKVSGSGLHGLITVVDVRAAARAPYPASAVSSPTALSPASRPRVSPLARRRAQALGLSLTGLAGTGPGGAIELADVERAARAGEAGSGPARRAAAARMRRAIAAAVTRAKREIPHYYLTTTVDMGPASAWLEGHNAGRPVSERLVIGALLLKATALAVRHVPELNALWTGREAPPLPAVHLGVAITLRSGGLCTPAIRDAEVKPLLQLMAELSDLVKRARQGRLRASELGGATLTVTSLGERGVETVIPIIQPPQVAMVGFGKVVTRPWVVEDAVVPRPVVVASLAADHRVSDGHRGGRFLAALDEQLQNPEAL